jgi:prepilin-type N-terminal cleavage/methylation domain-containing protein
MIATSRKGFTLIELLIVVAIIAILAAIAVPNFLEAQTRSKVSRCKADLRSMATAFEAYNVDFNLYPWRPDNVGSSWTFPYTNPKLGGSDYVLPLSILVCVTTPVAYVTSIFMDPFQSAGRPMDSWGQALYAAAGRRGSYVLDRQAENMRILMPQIASAGSKWGIWGIGPDQTWLDTTNPPWNYSIYDATNGTVSKGNIWRVGP